MSESTATIGTLGEMSYHRQLKYRLMPDSRFHEQKVGRYVADIRCGNEIIEIQTRGFYKLKDKLAYFLSQGYRVTVAYPIEAVKWLVWVHPGSGEATRRRSPKKGKAADLLPEMYGIRELLSHPNLSFLAVLAETEELRLLSEKGRNSKKGAKRLERTPLSFLEEIHYSSPEDFLSLIPASLPERFTIKDYIFHGGFSKRDSRSAHDAVGALEALGLVERDGKQGRAFQYRWNPPATAAGS